MQRSATTIGAASVFEPCLLSNLAKLLDDARKEFDGDREAAKSLLTRAASLLRVELDRHAAGTGSDRRMGGLVAWQIRRLNVLIHTRLDQPIRLKELSAVSRLSTAHFCRAFKQTFHDTPHSYIVRQRLLRAESLMLTSDLSLGDIAARCGLTDQAHLCKLFRLRHGQTPAVWRRERTDITVRRARGSYDQEYSIKLH
jgi:AraC-like DNA-binding protein